MSAKTARLLLDEGKLPDEAPEGTPPDKIPPKLEVKALKDLAWEATALAIDRSRGLALESPEAAAVATAFVRGAAKVATRGNGLAAAMVTRFAYFGPVWAPEAVMRATQTSPDGPALIEALQTAKSHIARVNKLARVE